MRETFNGGITLTLGDHTLKRITEYSPSYDYEKETFQMYDGSICEKLKGIRYRANITTGIMDAEEINTLRAVISGHRINLTAPDFSGAVFVQSASKPLEVANDGRKYYRMSFAVAAVELTGGSGSL